MTKRARAAAGVALSACLLSACGSTVPLAQRQGLTTDNGLGSGAGTTVDTVPGSVTAPTETSAPTSLLPGAGSSSSAGGRTATTPTTAAAVDPATARVATPTQKPVEVGFVIYPDVGAAAAALGSSAEVGDQRAEVNDAVGWVNAHGGLAGHRISPVFFEVSLTSTQTYAQSYQQACSTFTEDHHVIATVFIGNAEAGLPTCLAKGKSLFLAHGHFLHDAKDYAQLTNMVTTEDAGSDRVARAMVDRVLAKGLVKSGDTLGLMVMSYGGPQRARDEIVVPMLKAKGVAVISYEVPYPQSTPDISNSAAAVQSAQLKMAAAGVKAVAFLCPGCMSFFMQDAESQGYYPTYVATSWDSVGANTGKGHGRSLAGALALGWDPIRDVGTYADPSPLAGNATYAVCRTVEKANITSDATNYASQAMCGATMDLYAAAQKAPGPLTWTSLMSGFTALGTSHAGAGNFSTALTPSRRDGTAAFRTMHYDAEKDRFAYDGSTTLPLP